MYDLNTSTWYGAADRRIPATRRRRNGTPAGLHATIIEFVEARRPAVAVHTRHRGVNRRRWCILYGGGGGGGRGRNATELLTEYFVNVKFFSPLLSICSD